MVHQDWLMLIFVGVLGGLIVLVSEVSGLEQNYLLWNLFLALIPYYVARLRNARGERKRRGWQNRVLEVVWLLFYPNAFYIVTDLIHIQNDVFYTVSKTEATYIMSWVIWARLLLLFATVFVAVMLTYHAFYEMLLIWQQQFKGWWATVFFTIGISVLTGAGIVMGRFDRLNSWDIIRHPLTVVTIFLHSFMPDRIIYTAMFALLHAALVIFLRLIEKNRLAKNS